ncbi:hydantoinase/oxoprolinase family protein [Bosea sp. 2KB_26]|uniref:hydantoinase/oxoprolinase family protein n=1 Tax=Bosea sp. 2KB_26 TaxID=3237475 RepID=UPI003F935EB0
MTARSFRVGADIGGTFTDITFLENGQTVHSFKRPSTPDDYSRGIVEGVLALLDRIGGKPTEIEEVVHATTVATNAILEGKGATTALLTTRGFRDVLELGRLRMPELYNLNYEKPTPLVPRHRRYEIAERMGAHGDIVLPLDEDSVVEAARSIAASDTRAVAVSFLHAYANPQHERRACEILTGMLGPEIFVSCSSDVLPEIREYERTSTVVVNAYLGPVVRSYLRALSTRLRDAGIHAPLQVMQSSGGVMSALSASEKPACIIESGPAAGVIAAARIGAAGSSNDIITIDMGGTTAKAAIIEQGQPARTTEYEVGAGINISSKLIKGGGHAVKLPFIDVSEIGAGGGSIIRVDAGGLIQVGPDSAGAVPGPACYGTGGTRPTLTDALVVLGYINPDYIAGGAVRLDAERSRRAISEQVCAPTGLDLETAAHGVYAIAASTMMRAVKAVSTYRGRDPRDFTLFAFGGNGPAVAAEIARLLDMKRVVVPSHPGVFSALGLLYSTTEHDLMQTYFCALDAIDSDRLDTAYRKLETSMFAGLEADGFARADIEIDRLADLRYAGQAYELTIGLNDRPGDRIDIAAMGEAFHREHKQTYGHASTSDPLEIVNIRVTGRPRSDRTDAYRPSAPDARTGEPGSPSVRTCWFGPDWGHLETPIITRLDLAAGDRESPLIVEEYDATCVVPPGWTAGLDELGNLVLTASER